MKLSDGEKLIAIMLVDIMQANKISGEIDPAFVKEAITGGDLWALKWKYSGLFHDEGPDEETVKETVDILSMCSILEYSISQLDAGEQAKIPEHDQTVFVGFDGNHDDHFGVATMLIQTMGLWDEFHGSPLNSHFRVIDRYRRMLAAYAANGGAARSPLSLSEIQTILGIAPSP